VSVAKRRNRISGQFAALLESPAYRALSASGHEAISRIEIELAHRMEPMAHRLADRHGLKRDNRGRWPRKKAEAA
jgi:hypothetical protein